jgi:hypothetical protein
VAVVGLIIVVSIGYKLGPVYLSRMNLEDDLTRIVNQAGANHWQDQVIREHIVAAVQAQGFRVVRRSIKIVRGTQFRSASRIRVTVPYSREITLPGYVHALEFVFEGTALVGRL